MEKNRTAGQNGKGSQPRPISVSREQFEKNWDRIFNSKNKKNTNK